MFNSNFTTYNLVLTHNYIKRPGRLILVVFLTFFSFCYSQKKSINSLSSSFTERSTSLVQIVGGGDFNIIPLHLAENIEISYTNPNCNSLYFKTKNISGDALIALYDMLGNVLLKEKMTINEGEINNIKFRFINNGNYILKIESINKVFTQKIIYRCG